MLVRGDSLSKIMSQYLIDQITGTPNIRVLCNTNVAAVDGENHLETVTIADSAAGTEEIAPAAALFIFIGALPRTDWVAGALLRDAPGFILTGPDLLQDGKPPKGWTLPRMPFWLEASVPGVFVAGDVRHESVKRVASAVGEGAMAVQFIHRYLASL